MEHTLLPWELRGTWIFAENTNLHIASIARASDGDWNKENAELIVRAVNSHYQLIEALEELAAIRIADNWTEINKPLVYRGITQDRGISERIDKAIEILKLAKGK